MCFFNKKKKPIAHFIVEVQGQSRVRRLTLCIGYRLTFKVSFILGHWQNTVKVAEIKEVHDRNWPRSPRLKEYLMLLQPELAIIILKSDPKATRLTNTLLQTFICTYVPRTRA